MIFLLAEGDNFCSELHTYSRNRGEKFGISFIYGKGFEKKGIYIALDLAYQCSPDHPYIKEHRFKTHGAIEQGGMLLAFASEAAGRAREEAPARKSADLVKHYTEDLAKQGSKKDGGFYQPETDEGESEDAIEMELDE